MAAKWENCESDQTLCLRPNKASKANHITEVTRCLDLKAALTAFTVSLCIRFLMELSVKKDREEARSKKRWVREK